MPLSVNSRTTLLARTADNSQLDGKNTLLIGTLSVCPSTWIAWESFFRTSATARKAWLDSSPALAEAGKTWAELLTIAQSANELNRTNGLLINRHMVRNQNALNVLQGAPQGGNIYGPNGQPANKAKTRGLVVG